MPYRIETPECWFRTRQIDLYVLEYQVSEEHSLALSDSEALNTEYREDQKILHAWFSENLPATELQIVGPSEYSGYITGGPCSITADFDEASLTTFRAAWEKPDSRWQIELQTYNQWLVRIRSCVLLPVPLATQQRVLWWDTPEGFILLSAVTDNSLLSRWDAWWLLPQLLPVFKNANMDDFPCGEYFPDEDPRHSYVVIDYGDVYGDKWRGDDYEKTMVQIAKLREALGIPTEDFVNVVVGD
jgi:hypothetical protein